MTLYNSMNKFIKYFVLLSMCISNVYAFTNNLATHRPLVKPLRTTCNKYDVSMSLYRRDFCKVAAAAAAAAISLAIPKTSKAEYEPDTSWTLHNGPFTESELVDYVKCSSGLLYKDVEIGSGPMPNEGDSVKIHMVGYIFETGEKWANTYKGIPTFQSAVRAGVRPNQKFMKGLNEGVLTMKRGGKRILVIPAYLAYNYVEMLSEKNPGVPIIPGGSSLVCYVEVLDFKSM